MGRQGFALSARSISLPVIRPPCATLGLHFSQHAQPTYSSLASPFSVMSTRAVHQIFPKICFPHTCKITWGTTEKKLIFNFYLILTNLNLNLYSHIRLMATLLDTAALDFRCFHQFCSTWQVIASMYESTLQTNLAIENLSKVT